jgi:hypothetical protein
MISVRGDRARTGQGDELNGVGAGAFLEVTLDRIGRWPKIEEAEWLVRGMV